MAKKKELTPEEKEVQIQKRIKEALDAELKDLRSNFNPKNPTYSFEPGEEVLYGAHEKTVVKEVVDEGLYYLVEIFNPKEKNSNFHQAGLRYLSWIQLRKKGDFQNQPIYRNKSHDMIHYSQQAISSFFVNVYMFGVDMNPEYQRDHVWNESDKVELIDSIMNNVDIGKFVFVQRDHAESKEKGTGYYEILDGKQRLNAIIEFFEDRFRYKGKVFSELHGYDRAHFVNYSVSVATLTNFSLEKRMETFIRLNTAGRIMDKEHLEKVKQMLLK